MNKGLELATGDVIGLLNADDFYASTDVLQAVAGVLVRPDVDACYGDLCYVGRVNTERIVRYWRSSAFTPGSFSHGWVPPHPTLFVRRAVYAACGGFDESYRIAADFELMLRLLEVERIRAEHLPKILVMMRVGGLTSSSFGNIISQNREILTALRQHRIPHWFGSYLLSKLWERWRQFILRPAG
jgi:hypothetical protein